MEKEEVHVIKDETFNSFSSDAHGEDVNLSRRGLFFPSKLAKAIDKSDFLSPSLNQTAQVFIDDSVKEAAKTVVLTDAVGRLIRETSTCSKLAFGDLFFTLFEQPSLLLVNVDGEDMLLENVIKLDSDEKKSIIVTALEALHSDPKYDDIIELVGNKNRYYYSVTAISSNFAKMLMLVEEQDYCATIAEMVRFECSTYPRPYAIEMLKYAPFFMTQVQIDVALTVLQHQQECKDILPVMASNDALYLYSSKHMSQAMAQGLCEWIEVEQFDNP